MVSQILQLLPLWLAVMVTEDGPKSELAKASRLPWSQLAPPQENWELPAAPSAKT